MGGIVITDPGLPRLKTEHPDVAPGTPLAVVGLFLKALQYRFTWTESEPLPWVWDANLTPLDTEEEAPVAGEPRKLMIEAAYNTDKAQRNYRPAIYVGTGDITPAKTIVDNFVGENLPAHFRAFHSMATMPIVFHCDGENYGESTLIADTAWMFILASRDIFREAFSFHEITNPVLGQTAVMQLDKEIWRTAITFSVQFDLRWTTRPIAPLIQDIRLAIADSEHPLDYYIQIALRDSGS